MSKKTIKDLTDTLKIMEIHADNPPAIPEKQCFYRTFNSSIVYVTEHQYRGDDEMSAVVLVGGAGNTRPGDSYWLTSDGYHRDKEITPEVVLALAEKLDIKLPIQ